MCHRDRRTAQPEVEEVQRRQQAHRRGLRLQRVQRQVHARRALLHDQLRLERHRRTAHHAPQRRAHAQAGQDVPQGNHRGQLPGGHQPLPHRALWHGGADPRVGHRRARRGGDEGRCKLISPLQMKLFFNFISLLFLLVLRPSLKCSPSPVLTVQRCASSRRTETCRRRSPSQEFSISTCSLPLHSSKRFHSSSFLCLFTPHSTIFYIIFPWFYLSKKQHQKYFFGCCFFVHKWHFHFYYLVLTLVAINKPSIVSKTLHLCIWHMEWLSEKRRSDRRANEHGDRKIETTNIVFYLCSTKCILFISFLIFILSYPLFHSISFILYFTNLDY